MDINDTEACYRAVKSRDRRFDGVFYIAVRTTGIYCRPSCPAQTPQLKNVSFYRTAAAAQGAGYRACKRCLPDATPGSPEWDVDADAAGRAMRLIADGLVEREGVEGLARRLGYSSRHLTRLLTAEVGAGPLALARAKRAQTARTLIETSTMGFADVAFASGFASVRQFNDTIREVYAASPTDLRGRSRVERTSPGRIELRLAVRAPFNAPELLEFLRLRLVKGVEVAGDDWYARSLRLPHGHGVARLDFGNLTGRGGTTEFVGCTLELADVRDLPSAVERCRRLIDADCDPVAVDDELGADQLLAPLVRKRPGLRVPGHVDGAEVAVRAVLGQQVTVRAAATAAARLTEQYGETVATGTAGITHLFPSAETLGGIDVESLPMPRARGRALVALCRAVADGQIALDRSADRADVRAAMLALPGIGPWTAEYIAMRALGDPDVFLPTDIGVKHALAKLGAADPEAWRPWRSYALMHLWTSLTKDGVPMWTLMDSPVGELRIVARDVNGQRAITAIDFMEQPDAPAQLNGRPRGDRADADPLLQEAVRQLTAYFARDLKEFELPLAPEGTPFQQSVWEQLLTIGYGESTSYGVIAGRLGKTGHGARAVGLANGRNPIPIVIPCHRVVGADGSLTGYGGGIERKQILLDLETDALF